jgi:hypothetical protein
MVNQLQLLGLFFAVLWYNISKGKKVRMISKHGFAGRFAPNIIKKGYDSIAVSCIRPYCMVKKTDKHCTKYMITCCFVCTSLLLQPARVALD